MVTRAIFGVFVMMFLMIQAANAGGKDRIQNYFNDTACQVKATDDPVQKRAILDNSLQSMSKALEKVESVGLVSDQDRAGIERFRTTLEAKHDELTGSNGFERVADGQLNAFSDYVLQDMEQADRTISISLVSALLIVIIIILLS